MADLRLTEPERLALLDSLDAKQRQLSPEARRTDSIRVHEEMRERVRILDRLI